MSCLELSAGSRHGGVCFLGAQENNIESGPSPMVGAQKEGRGCDSRAMWWGGWPPGPRERRCSLEAL